MKKNGQITVFLSLVFLCLLSLMCGLIESARMAGARCYLKLAADSALDSVFSGYHRKAFEDYRIFLLESGEEEILKEWESFIEPLMKSSGWYSLKENRGEITDLSRITDHGGEDFKQEILDYMRYGILDQLPDEEGAENMLKSIKEAGAVKAAATAYCYHTKEAVRLERALEEINKSLKNDQSFLLNAYGRADDHDGNGFRRELKLLETEMNRLPALVKAYGKKADALKENLEQTNARFSELGANISGDVSQAIQEDTLCYKSYIEKDGERRKEIEAMPEKLKSFYPVLERARERSIEVEEIIDNWSDDDGGPDISGLWDRVGDILDDISIPLLSYTNGVKDTEKERLLEQVESLANSGLLTLILPEDSQISKGVLDTRDFPSALYEKGEGNHGGLIDRLIVNEYCEEFFDSFLSEGDKEAKYELEYLISGKNTDEENLKKAVSQILLVREGMNLVHILSDSQKREEAKALAAIITGVTGLVPLNGVITFFIMGIWALGEAIMDLKLLLDGRKVPFIKSRDTWNLSLEGILELGKQGNCPEGQEDEKGIDYTGYLKLLLFAGHSALLYYRLMDVIQLNIRRVQDDFLISDCIYWAEISGTADSEHLFFSGGQPFYQMEVRTEKAY